MRNKSWILVAAAFALVVAGGWFWIESVTRPPAVEHGGPRLVVTPPRPVSVPTLAPGPVQPTTPAGGGISDSLRARTDADGEPGEMDPLSTPTAAAPLLPNVGDILSAADDDHVRVAKKLAALVVDLRLPPEEREDALGHALNLSAGNEAEVLIPLIEDPKLPDELAETVLNEALNSPLAYQADLYLAALPKRTTPAMQTLIRDHLAFLTGGSDLGSNASAWKAAIAKAKKEWEE